MPDTLKFQFIDEEDLALIKKLVTVTPKVEAVYSEKLERLRDEQVGKQFLLALRDLQQLFGSDNVVLKKGKPKHGSVEMTINSAIKVYGIMFGDLALPFIYALSKNYKPSTSKTYLIFGGVFCPPCAFEISYILDLAEREKARVVIVSGDDAEDLAELFGVSQYPSAFILNDNKLNPLFAEPLEINEDDFRSFVDRFSQMINI